MRHNKKINHLGRTNSHRKAMLSNMAASLILHKRIKTTLAKAKALRVFVEPIITKSKEDTTHSRRLAFGYLQDKRAVSELFREVSPKIMERPGGYTRILKIGNRFGDAAEMCYIELVDFNEGMLEAKTAAETKTTRRSRRGSKKKVEGEVVQQTHKADVDGDKVQGETKGIETEDSGPVLETEAGTEETKEETPGLEEMQDKNSEPVPEGDKESHDMDTETAAEEAEIKVKDAEAKGKEQQQDQDGGSSEADERETKNASSPVAEGKNGTDQEDKPMKKEE